MTWRLDVRVEMELKGSPWSSQQGGPSSSMQEVNDYLKSLRDKLSREQMKGLLDEVADLYYQNTIERFRSHTNPKGQSWKWLKPQTVDYKTNGMYDRSGRTLRPPAIKSVSLRRAPPSLSVTPNTQLIWTGKLIKAIRTVVDPRRGTIRIGLDSREVPYAWVHQMGYSTKNIPMRKFLGYNKKTNDAAMRAISNYLLNAKPSGA